MTTVGDYLATRFAQLGLKDHFVVPGDYNLILLDKLLANPDLNQVGCANELNCSFAAEGYARANGLAACVVTFSVGAFSAFNGIGGSYAENLPVILISGSPNTNDAGANHLLHHTLGTHDFSYQFEMAQKITCAAVAIHRVEEAPRLIDHAIRMALLCKKPAYIEIPTNLANAACTAPGPIKTVSTLESSDPDSLAAAIDQAEKFISSKLKPVLLAGPKLRAAGAEAAFLELAEALGCAVAVMPAAKSFFPETHPQYVGISWGQVSTLGANSIISWSDGILCAGAVFNDYSTVGWTAMPPGPLLFADYGHVSLLGADFSRVLLKDFLSGLAKRVFKNTSTMVEYARIRPDPPSNHVSDSKAALTRREITLQIQNLLTPHSTLFVETGDSWFNGIQMSLPEGSRFEIEMQWGHIGWSIPAAFGYGIATNESRKTIVMVGDGSFQMTAQEVSQMIRYGLPITIFLINNRGYTIEVEIHDGPYNNIKNWDYAALIEAFNAGEGHAKGIRVSTGGELKDAIEVAENNTKGPTLIECIVDRDDCSSELITWGRAVAGANARPPMIY